MAQNITRTRPVAQSNIFRSTGIGLVTAGIVAGSMSSANAFGHAQSYSSPQHARPSLSSAGTASNQTLVWNYAPAAQAPKAAPQQTAPAAQAPWAQQAAVQQAPAQDASVQQAPAQQPVEQQAPWAQQAPAPETEETADVQPAADETAQQADANVVDDQQIAPQADAETIQPVDDQSAVADQGQVVDPSQNNPYNGGAAEIETAAQDTSTLTGSRAQIVQDAYAGIGGAYVWGGKDYMAWDCSGFVSYVYAQSGIQVDAYTYTMKDQLVATDNPQAGDVVFTNGYAHVGIYVGNGQMVSALNPDQGTQLTSVDGGGMMTVDGYYTSPALG